MTYGLNIILGSIGESTPIVSFNHGMQNEKRVRAGIRFGMLYTVIIMLVGTLLLEIFANPFSKMFGLSGETQALCILAMRVISLSFIFAGANVAYQGIFQALDCGLESLIISVCRQFLFVLPVAWGFAQLARQNSDRMTLVWLTFFIAEAASFILASIFMKQVYKNKIIVMSDRKERLS